MKYTAEKFYIRQREGAVEVEGYTFKMNEKKFGVHKNASGLWGVTDIPTGLLISPALEESRKKAVEMFEKYTLAKYEKFVVDDKKYPKLCQEFLDLVCPKPEKTVEELQAEVEELKRQLEKAKSVKEHLREHVVVVDATPKKDESAEKVAKLISEFETIEIAGETTCAIYLSPTIKKDSPEMAAVKAAGGRYGNHKKYGKCWYMPKVA